MFFDILNLDIKEIKLVLGDDVVTNLVTIALGAGGVVIVFGLYAITVLHRIIQLISDIRKRG